MLGTTRVAELVDGVFAIAMTLLAFDLRVLDIISPIANRNIMTVIAKIGPHILIYAISFIILGFYWIEHRIQYGYVKYSSKYFYWINIFFLMFIALIPFSTGILGRYFGEQFSILLYGLNIILVGALSYFHWWYVNFHHLVSKDTTPITNSIIKKSIILAPVIAIISMAISFFSLWTSLFIYFVIPIYYIFLSRHDLFSKQVK
jgi:uncharacterized membrane protein